MRLFEGTPWDRPPRCERCGELLERCQCPPPPEPRTPPNQQRVKLAVEKRKQGKIVTVVRGLADEGDHLRELLGKLKQACGAGGAVQDGALEIQGQHAERIASLLQEWGYRART